jgi:hypothetical protein
MVHMRKGIVKCGYVALSELTSQTTKQRNTAMTTEAEELYVEGGSSRDAVCLRALRPT